MTTDAQIKDDAGDTDRCAGCSTHTEELYASGQCVGCADAATSLVIEALESAETPLTRAQFAASLAAEWPSFASAETVTDYYLDELLDDEEAEEISQGRFQLVPDDEPPRSDHA